MVVVLAGVIFGVLAALDAYTRHGEAVVVPDVKGLSLAEAQTMFADRGLNCVVADSSYVKTYQLDVYSIIVRLRDNV